MSQPFNSYNIKTRALALLVALFALTSTAVAQTPAPETLAPGRTVARELGGGQAHAFRLELTKGQFARVVVEQKGVDVVAVLLAPDGKQLSEVDSPNGTQGPEPLSFVTDAHGVYTVEVRSLDKGAAAGQYEIRVEEVRAEAERDRTVIAAETATREAQLLYVQQTADALRAAVPKFEEAAGLWHAAADAPHEAYVLDTLGIIHDDLGERPKAVAYFNRALPLLRQAGDRAAEGATLHNLAMAHKNLGEQQKALEFYGQALAARRAAGDRNGEAATLHDIGDVNTQLGNHDKAIALYEQARAIFREAGNAYGEAVTIRDLGHVYKDLGEPARAIEHYLQALPRIREAGDRRREAATLNDLGLAHKTLGNLPQALDFLKQSLAVTHATGDRVVEGYTLGSIASVHDDLGEKQQALELNERALATMRAVGERYGEAIVLNNLGVLYSSLGEPNRAVDFYTQSLEVSRAIGDRASQAYTLLSIGQALHRAGDDRRALEQLHASLALMRELGQRDGEARALDAVSSVQHSAGDYRRAVETATQSLELYRAIGNRLYEARVLSNLGVVHADLGEWPRALDIYERALVINRAVGDRDGEADTLYNLGRAELRRGRPDAARAHAEEALRIVEAIRGQLKVRELRASYRSKAQRFYDLYIDTLMQLHRQTPSAGHDALALQTSERARARMLLEALAEAGADIRQGADAELVARERELGRALDAKVNSQFRLLSGRHTEEAARTIAKEIADLTAQYEQVQARIRATSPRYAALTQPATLSLREMQTSVLDRDTVLLEYALGEERSYVWAVTSDSVTSAELPKRSELEALARAAYRRLTTPSRATTAAAFPAELSRLAAAVLGPVAARLKGRRVVVVADGALQYIPFAALPLATARGRAAEPLVVSHEVVSLPSASTLSVLRREAAGRAPAPKALAVLADPVFGSDDERLKSPVAARVAAGPDAALPKELRGLTVAPESSADGAGRTAETFPRLPGTRQEALGLLSLVAPADRKEALDFNASRATATGGELEQYRYVHLATHGYVDSARPELSGVLLSMFDERGQPQDGFMRAREVFNLKLRADLVVLSACRTGLGKELLGEGLVGLTRGFMYAGSPRVVSSLWSVSDAATAELMTDFYTRMIRHQLRPAEALRQAQIAMWRRRERSAPFYWAAFTLQGEWR
jgi:CHAT domain-containing protein/tetratricopeptide (TPR) repeat protein